MSEKIEQNTINQFDKNAIEKNGITRNKLAYIPHFKAYLENLPTPLLKILLGICPPRNMLTEQPSQVLFLIKTGGSEKF